MWTAEEVNSIEVELRAKEMHGDDGTGLLAVSPDMQARLESAMNALALELMPASFKIAMRCDFGYHDC